MTADLTPTRITTAADREQHPAGPALDGATLAALTDYTRALAALARAEATAAAPIVLHGPEVPAPRTEAAPAPIHVTIPTPAAPEQHPAGRRLYSRAEVAHLAALAGTGASLTGVAALITPGPWALAAPVVCALAALGSRIAMTERATVQTLRTGHDRHGRPIAETPTPAALTARQ